MTATAPVVAGNCPHQWAGWTSDDGEHLERSCDCCSQHERIRQVGLPRHYVDSEVVGSHLPIAAICLQRTEHDPNE